MRFETIRFVVSFRQVSLLLLLLLLFRAFDIKVFTVFRLEFEARKRSAASKVLPSTINQRTHIQDTHTRDTQTHIHYNNSNNNFKYACALLDQIQFSEAEAKGEGEMRGGERETVGEGARGFNCRTCLLRLAFFVQHTKRGTHLSIFHRES